MPLHALNMFVDGVSCFLFLVFPLTKPLISSHLTFLHMNMQKMWKNVTVACPGDSSSCTEHVCFPPSMFVNF